MPGLPFTDLGRACPGDRRSEFIQDYIVLQLFDFQSSPFLDLVKAKQPGLTVSVLMRGTAMSAFDIEQELRDMEKGGWVYSELGHDGQEASASCHRRYPEEFYCLSQEGLDYYNSSPIAAKRWMEATSESD